MNKIKLRTKIKIHSRECLRLKAKITLHWYLEAHTLLLLSLRIGANMLKSIATLQIQCNITIQCNSTQTTTVWLKLLTLFVKIALPQQYKVQLRLIFHDNQMGSVVSSIKSISSLTDIIAHVCQSQQNLVARSTG
jgi:hypothetical protein